MADNHADNSPIALPRDEHHHADKYGTKFVDKTEKYAQKFEGKKSGGKDEEKKPAGGYDDTTIPKAPPGYTLRIIFHRAENLPFADLPSFSSDPYIWAVLKTDLQKRHKQDPDLQLRTPTIHRNTNPTWNTVWTIAHVPASGFHLKCRLYDEDPTDHDDRLGNVHVDVERIDDGWTGFKERSFEIKKRMGSKRAYTVRGCIALFSRRVSLDGKVVISVENLGKSEGNGGRAFTVSPLPWTQHFSPLIGMIAGVKNKSENKDGKGSTERYNFQAIQMQLQGPVPEHLYHRYVEFRPFVAGMFTSHSLRGRILNHALHHQHARIYNFDGSTKYGEFEKPSVETSKKFLEFVNYDRGGRIYTYVITLDGQFRFTETGKEFGIDLLSKHTMHSDVSIYIAFSGEFFIRRLKHTHQDENSSADAERTAPSPLNESPNEEGKNKQKESHHDLVVPDEHSNPTHASSQKSGPHHSWKHRAHSASSSTRSPAPHADQTKPDEEVITDPSHYELIIDNDSGTYRPNAKYLGQLKKFLQHNFPGMRVATLDCQKDEEKMQKLKKEQRERKKKSGQQITYMQNASSSSISSSDEEDLERRAGADQEPETSASNRIQPDVSEKTSQSVAERADPSTTDIAANSTSRKNGLPNRVSTSTGGEKASFDTATEHGDGHFVTPKPSLGDGGLGQFDPVESTPLERGIDEELEKRGMSRMSQDNERFVSNEKANSRPASKPEPSSIHHAVTSTA